MWTLRAVQAHPDHPLSFRLLPGHMRTIGRSAAATCIVDAPLVSRVHCRITVAGDGSVEVVDLGSTNGTWINGEQVTMAPLREGNVLRVGRVEFVLERDETAGGCQA